MILNFFECYILLLKKANNIYYVNIKFTKKLKITYICIKKK